MNLWADLDYLGFTQLESATRRHFLELLARTAAGEVGKIFGNTKDWESYETEGATIAQFEAMEEAERAIDNGAGQGR